ncbi:MAG: hypothetical protein ABI137_01050 [Antricoccus sp.]
MAIAILIVSAVICVPALWLGARRVRVWDERRDPNNFTDLVHQGVTNLLRLSIVAFMIATGAVGVIGSIIALRQSSTPQRGVIICAAAAVLTGLGLLWDYARRRAKTR